MKAKVKSFSQLHRPSFKQFSISITIRIFITSNISITQTVFQQLSFSSFSSRACFGELSEKYQSTLHCSTGKVKSSNQKHDTTHWSLQERTPQVLSKNDEKNLIRQNQIALFIHIQLFFLSNYEKEKHLLWRKCFNVPYWSRRVVSTNARQQHTAELSKSKKRVGMVWSH